MKRLALVVVLLVLFPLVAHTQKKEIPSDLRKLLNQGEFLAIIAQRCSFDLDVLGKKGIDGEDCALLKKKKYSVGLQTLKMF
ncbi:MAG: hypothetical protein ACE5FU_12045 [Nitrospinota bacterium]